MPLPFDQWQFYVVTAVAMLGLWALVRPFLRRSTGGCHGCGSAPRRVRRTPLTIEKRAPRRKEL
jgi:hypothetical protein